MKFKKFLTAFALSSILFAGSLFAALSSKQQKVEKASALTDLGTFVFDSASVDSTPTGMYGINSDENDAPAGWDTQAFAPVDENSGTFVDGVRVGTEIKKVNADTYYIAVPGGKVGTVATVKGTWANSTYQFTVEEFVRKCVVDGAGAWDYALEDYDVFSLKDANLPDFVNTAINTEDAAGYGYISYDESGYAKKYLPKQKGIYGATNQTSSYSFQFYFEANGKMEHGFTDIRIGSNGGWDSGHFFFFKLSNTWHDDGCARIHEFYDGETQRQIEFRTDVSTGKRLIEVGTIKVRGYDSKYYVFFKNNGVTAYGQYWDIGEDIRTTKIGIYSQDSVSITNSIEPVATKLTLSNDSTATALYFNTTTDVLPFINSWSLYFIPQDSTGYTYNGADASVDKLNYFKKVGQTGNSFFLYFPDQGITPAAGDTFHLGGIFKLVDYIGSDPKISMVYKVVIEDCDFQFDGTAWHAVNVDYTAVAFAKDLLKSTLSICTGVGGNNHDTLVPVWESLADFDHFGGLLIAQKEILRDAVADPDLEAPTTTAEVDAMDGEDAIAVAMYRYDYCTAKYSLTNFVTGRTVPSSLSSNNVWNISSSNNTFVLVIIFASTAVVLAAGIIILRRRKADR